MAEDAGPAPPPPETKKRRRGVLSRMWRGLFGGGREDYEKRLRHLSKEESLVHLRMRRRAHASRRITTNLITLSVLLEVAAVGYAIMTTRALDLNWQMRAVRVLPMFVLPALSSVIYSTLLSLIRMLDRKDQKMLESLRSKRQAKIDELKERSNYYITQQLIQKYDLDPAAKAAAATVLASKLGADSGLKVYVGDENEADATRKSNDVQLAQYKGLRNRKSSYSRDHGSGSAGTPFIEEMPHEYGADDQVGAVENHRMVEHYKGPTTSDGGWLARIAAMLVGEDPTQCYALICGNCHMHNGLARKEDYPYITYYCPHCHALNGSRQPADHGSGSISYSGTPLAPHDGRNDPSWSNATSVRGNEGRTNLTTSVEELPAGECDEREVDGRTS